MICSSTVDLFCLNIPHSLTGIQRWQHALKVSKCVRACTAHTEEKGILISGHNKLYSQEKDCGLQRFQSQTVWRNFSKEPNLAIRAKPKKNVKKPRVKSPTHTHTYTHKQCCHHAEFQDYLFRRVRDTLAHSVTHPLSGLIMEVPHSSQRGLTWEVCVTDVHTGQMDVFKTWLD